MTIASALVGRLALCDRGSDTDTHRQRFWYHVNARPTRPPTEPMPTADKWRAEGRLEKRAAPGVWQPRVALVAGERLYVARRRQAAMADVQLAMRAYDLSHAKMSVTTHVGDRQATVVSMTMRAGNGKPLKARLRGPAAIERFAHVLVHWAKSADTRAVLDAHIKFAYVLDRRHTQAIDEDKSTITASNSDELETLQAPSATGANAKPVALPSAIKVTSMTPEMQAEVAEDKRQRQMVTSAPCVLPSTVATHEEIMQDITSSTSIATDGDPCHEIFSQCLLKMCPDRIALKSSSSVGSNTATDTIEMATDTVDDFASQVSQYPPTLKLHWQMVKFAHEIDNHYGAGGNVLAQQYAHRDHRQRRHDVVDAIGTTALA